MQDDERPFSEEELRDLVETPMAFKLAETHSMVITLSAAELRLLAKKARECEMPVSTYIHDAALMAAEGSVPVHRSRVRTA